MSLDEAIATTCARRSYCRYLAGVMRDGSDFDDSVIVSDVQGIVAMAFEAQPKYARRAVSSLYRNYAKASVNSTMREIRAALLNQVLRNPKARTRDVTKMLEDLGVSGEDSVIQTLVMTQRSIAQNARTWIEYIENPRVWGFEYRTAEDERVRKSHRPFDGVRYAKRDPFWRRYAPPNGWNCRCELVPIFFKSRAARRRAFRGTPDVDHQFLFNPGRLVAG